MHVRLRVAAREHSPATDAGATLTPRTARFSCRGHTIGRTGRQENAPPGARCPLFFGAEAEARSEIQPAGSKGPDEIVSLERNGEGLRWLPKSCAHQRGKYPNFRDAGLRRLAGNAGASPACSKAARRLRREIMCRRA